MASAPPRRHAPRRQRHGLEVSEVAELLVRWRARELRLARRFRECGGASPAEIEDIYDAIAGNLVLEDRSFDSPEHLRSALRVGIRLRALRLHRDRATRTRIVQNATPNMLGEQSERSWRTDPQRALLAHEDDLIIGEFLAELSPLERRVFALVAEGHSWRAIATRLDLPEPKARALTRSCERKRERFCGLYIAGRLCGYRSATIAAVLTGAHSTDLAIRQALAHLRHCHTCQTEHKTSEAQLRAMFDQRALALLPLPLLTHARMWVAEQLAGPFSRMLRAAHRTPTGPTGVRERVIEAAGVASGGAAAKLAAGAIGVAVLAGGAVGITSSSHHHARQHHHPAHTQAPVSVVAPTPPQASEPVRQSKRHTRDAPRRGRYEPGGFAYLGVPVTKHASSARRAPAVTQHGGGPFSP